MESGLGSPTRKAISAEAGSSTRESIMDVPAQSYNSCSQGSAAEVEKTLIICGVAGGVLVEQAEIHSDARISAPKMVFRMDTFLWSVGSPITK